MESQVILSKLNSARIAYGVDRAVQANLASPVAVVDWSRATNATKTTWLQYVSAYNSSGTVPTLGSDVHRTSAFSAVMAVLSPRFVPGHIPGRTADFTAAASNLVLDLSSDATEQINISGAVDSNGDAVSGETYTYVSAEPTHASVSSTGLVTGLIVDASVVITVTSSSGVSKTLTFSVQA
jgi:hypothetical protein